MYTVSPLSIPLQEACTCLTLTTLKLASCSCLPESLASTSLRELRFGTVFNLRTLSALGSAQFPNIRSISIGRLFIGGNNSTFEVHAIACSLARLSSYPLEIDMLDCSFFDLCVADEVVLDPIP